MKASNTNPAQVLVTATATLDDGVVASYIVPRPVPPKVGEVDEDEIVFVVASRNPNPMSDESDCTSEVASIEVVDVEL